MQAFSTKKTRIKSIRGFYGRLSGFYFTTTFDALPFATFT